MIESIFIFKSIKKIKNTKKQSSNIASTPVESVAIVDESFISKTMRSLRQIRGGKKIYGCTNIFLKNFEALTLESALGPTPAHWRQAVTLSQRCLWLDLHDFEAF